MRFLITGSAGFIGFHLAQRLLRDGHNVVGVDNFSSYYDPALKEARNAKLASGFGDTFAVHRLSLEDGAGLASLWTAARPDIVVHLAAQAGVRYSIEHPTSYIASNLVGTFNVLECARHRPPAHLLVASSSSVYGANDEVPFRETDRIAWPVSLYAATKASTELMGHSYSHLFGIPTTFFRFFTVYGPWGRPDMALFKFTEAMIAGKSIDIYGEGKMSRDFTYVDDLVEAIVRLGNTIPRRDAAIEGDTLSPVAPYRVVNIGGGKPENLMDFIAELERILGIDAIKRFLPMQDGDVRTTFASPDLLRRLTSYKPQTNIAHGIQAFVQWYRAYYHSQ